MHTYIYRIPLWHMYVNVKIMMSLTIMIIRLWQKIMHLQAQLNSSMNQYTVTCSRLAYNVCNIKAKYNSGYS